MLQVLEIIGALLIVAAFTLTQLGWLGATTRRSLWLNLVGSTILAAIALHRLEWGFLLLEGTWAIVSGFGLARRAFGPGSTRAALTRGKR